MQRLVASGWSGCRVGLAPTLSGFRILSSHSSKPRTPAARERIERGERYRDPPVNGLVARYVVPHPAVRAKRN